MTKFGSPPGTLNNGAVVRDDTHVVVLAAGKGTRMKSQVPKVLHRVNGFSLIERVLQTSARLAPASTTLVIGHGASAVRASLSANQDLQFVVQEKQLGTGHALLQTAPLLRGKPGTLVLLSGDVPLLTAATLQSLVTTHTDTGAAATVITAKVKRPFGYGRIVRTSGRISKIVEEKDASPAQRTITEINSGIYALDLSVLFEALDRIGTANKQGEYYLPDLIAIFRKQKRTVATWTVERAEENLGINSRSELSEVTAMVRQRRTNS